MPNFDSSYQRADVSELSLSPEEGLRRRQQGTRPWRAENFSSVTRLSMLILAPSSTARSRSVSEGKLGVKRMSPGWNFARRPSSSSWMETASSPVPSSLNRRRISTGLRALAA
jgi:hypothetical protein